MEALIWFMWSQVTVSTSDIRFAGTGADVFIELHGERGSVGQSALESGHDNFERNSIDHFLVKGPDVGRITSLRIWHANNGGSHSDWHLAQVQVALLPQRNNGRRCVLFT
jgi:hypothetical protein